MTPFAAGDCISGPHSLGARPLRSRGPRVDREIIIVTRLGQGLVAFFTRPVDLCLAAFTTLALGICAGLGYAVVGHYAPLTVIMDSQGHRQLVRAHGGTVGETLAAADVEVFPGDHVSAPLDARIPALGHILITRAFPITIATAQGSYTLHTTANDTGILKADPSLALGPFDRLEPRSGTPLTPGMTVQLCRVKVEDQFSQEAIPAPVSFNHDASLPRGATKLVKPGKAGVQEMITRRYFKDGVFSVETKLPGKVLVPAVPEVRNVGIRALAMSRSQRGNRVLTVEATAYEPGPRSCGKYADGYTATGRKATYGVCAVDPRVIPLGTRLFVEGYGVAVACDTGSAIKGLRVDVCFDTVAEAMHWGRRSVKVYILDDIPGIIPIPNAQTGKTERLVAMTKSGSAPAAPPVIHEPEPTPPAPVEAPPAATPPGTINLLDPDALKK
ncbi:MAG: 3D domain-containing protein [bacterium]